jgi:hypothetical protein
MLAQEGFGLRRNGDPYVRNLLVIPVVVLVAAYDSTTRLLWGDSIRHDALRATSVIVASSISSIALLLWVWSAPIFRRWRWFYAAACPLSLIGYFVLPA